MRHSQWATAVTLSLLISLAGCSKSTAPLIPGTTLHGRSFPALEKAPKIVEFFSYTCPHCSDLAPKVEAWNQAQTVGSDPVTFLPGDFGHPKMTASARLFFALQEAGLFTPQLHKALLEAISSGKLDPADPGQLPGWLSLHGAQKAMDHMDSPSVEQKMKAALQFQKAAGVTRVPQFVLDGRYAIEAGTSGSPEQLMKDLTQLRDFLWKTP